MSMTRKSEQMHGTTVLCVRKDNKVVLTADGQVINPRASKSL